MPGFTITDWGGKQMHKISLLNEIWAAFVERCVSLHFSPEYPQGISNPPVAGENADNSWPVKGLQLFIEINCMHFAQSHELTGEKRSSPLYFQDKDDLTPWTFLNLLQSVYGGYEASGFRRVPITTTIPEGWNWRDPSSPVYSHGRAAYHDIQGPWVLQDIYECLIRLVWPWWQLMFSHHDEQASNYGGGYFMAAWPEAKTAAEADWDSGWGLGVPGTMNYLNLRSYTTGFCDNLEGDSWYSANMTGGYGYSEIEPIGSMLRDTYFYIRSEKPYSPGISFSPNVFDANGNDYIVESLWQKIADWSGVNESSGLLEGPKIGSLVKPTWCSEPDMPEESMGPTNYTARGYRVADAKVIEAFDREGGYTYY